MVNRVQKGGKAHEASEAVEPDDNEVDRHELDCRVDDLLDGDYVTFEEHNENR